MLKTEEPKEQPVKKPRACPFLSEAEVDMLCIQERCILYNRLIKQCAIVDLAITMHEIEKYLMQLLGSRSRG